MSLSNVTSIYKNKGSRLLLENDRGIFIQTVLKKILDKMIYSETSDSINDSMSDSNIGARKGKNIRDHLFILYAIINSVVKGDAPCIDIQVYDVQKAFDALWLDDCFIDLYDSLPPKKKSIIMRIFRGQVHPGSKIIGGGKTPTLCKMFGCGPPEKSVPHPVATDSL